ncbi:MAG: TM2 domain-containing protein [Oscillospiraceae bacterium]|nr:TM2 domain-containing protein [Oscillospiraceae bacterium]
MYCRNCGNEMDAKAAVCVKCGVPVGKGTAFCPNCGEPSNPEAVICVKCGTSFSAAASGAKSKLAAGLLGIFLGGLGVHRFYLGYTKIGILQILASLCFGAGAVWGLIEGILILCGSTITTDANGVPLTD